MRHLIGKTRRRLRLRMPLSIGAGRGQAASVRSILRGGTIQTKLTVGMPGDRYEQEADRFADRVMSSPMPDSGATAAPGAGVQRMCDECEREPALVGGGKRAQRQAVEEEEEEIQTKRLPDALQRQPIEEEEEELQPKREAAGSTAGRSSDGGANAVSAPLARRISGLRDGGESLPRSARAFFEPRFGADFSAVRVHRGADAAETAKSLRARAYTIGRDVVFGPGEYAPDNHEGRRLMAHELTHVLQQTGGKGGAGGAEESAAPIRRWTIGTAPAPDPDWEVVPAAQVPRLNAAESIVRGLLSSTRCRNYFRDNCTNGDGDAALRNAFNNAVVYHMPADDDTFGEQLGVSNDIAYNQRSFRIGRFFMGSTLLHEMFHTCDPTFDANDEIDAETAAERCRLYTPFITDLSTRSAAVGDRITIGGVGFGGRQGSADRVEIGGATATVISWGFAGTESSVEIVAEVPAGAGAGGVVVINNNVRSNAARFTVT